MKSSTGRFLEDYKIGEVINHAAPRTITNGERALNHALYPMRHALHSSDAFARACGLPRSPLDDWAMFHVVFGKTVPDISLNAVANLGYAEGRWLHPVYTGDTLRTTSEVIGLKQNSNGKTGVIWLRTRGYNQHDTCVLEYVRWVMLGKRDLGGPAPDAQIPQLADAVLASDLSVPTGLDFSGYNTVLSGEPHILSDYKVGEEIDHIDGVTLTDPEHMMATRLWQNTAKVHFDTSSRPDGQRLIYGGHIISLARALSFNGLANAQCIAALNSGSHLAPAFAGDTIYARSCVLDKAKLDSPSVGAMRLRLIASKHDKDGGAPQDILDIDYWALIPTGV